MGLTVVWQVRTTLIVQGSAEQQAKALGPAVAGGLQVVGETWHEKTLPRHFDTGAQQRYGYVERKLSYMKEKAHRYHTRRPLYKTGALMEALTSRAKITANSKGVRVAMYGPTYLYQQKKANSRVDKAAEVTAIASDEEQTMTAQLDQHTTAELNALRTTETRQV